MSLSHGADYRNGVRTVSQIWIVKVFLDPVSPLQVSHILRIHKQTIDPTRIQVPLETLNLTLVVGIIEAHENPVCGLAERVFCGVKASVTVVSDSALILPTSHCLLCYSIHGFRQVAWDPLCPLPALAFAWTTPRAYAA